jgi:hypothetical protein
MWILNKKQRAVAAVGFFLVASSFSLALAITPYDRASGLLVWALTAIVTAVSALVLYWLETKK